MRLTSTGAIGRVHAAIKQGLTLLCDLQSWVAGGRFASGAIKQRTATGLLGYG